MIAQFKKIADTVWISQNAADHVIKIYGNEADGFYAKIEKVDGPMSTLFNQNWNALIRTLEAKVCWYADF